MENQNNKSSSAPPRQESVMYCSQLKVKDTQQQKQTKSNTQDRSTSTQALTQMCNWIIVTKIVVLLSLMKMINAQNKCPLYPRATKVNFAGYPIIYQTTLYNKQKIIIASAYLLNGFYNGLQNSACESASNFEIDPVITNIVVTPASRISQCVNVPNCIAEKVKNLEIENSFFLNQPFSDEIIISADIRLGTILGVPVVDSAVTRFEFKLIYDSSVPNSNSQWSAWAPINPTTRSKLLSITYNPTGCLLPEILEENYYVYFMRRGEKQFPVSVSATNYSSTDYKVFGGQVILTKSPPSVGVFYYSFTYNSQITVVYTLNVQKGSQEVIAKATLPATTLSYSSLGGIQQLSVDNYLDYSPYLTTHVKCTKPTISLVYSSTANPIPASFATVVETPANSKTYFINIDPSNAPSTTVKMDMLAVSPTASLTPPLTFTINIVTPITCGSEQIVLAPSITEWTYVGKREGIVTQQLASTVTSTDPNCPVVSFKVCNTTCSSTEGPISVNRIGQQYNIGINTNNSFEITDFKLEFSTGSVNKLLPLLVTICGNEEFKAPPVVNVYRVEINKTNPAATMIDYASLIPFIDGYANCKKITTIEVLNERGTSSLIHSSIKVTNSNPPQLTLTHNFTEPVLKFKVKATSFGGVNQTIDYVFVNIQQCQPKLVSLTFFKQIWIGSVYSFSEDVVVSPLSEYCGYQRAELKVYTDQKEVTSGVAAMFVLDQAMVAQNRVRLLLADTTYEGRYDLRLKFFNGTFITNEVSAGVVRIQKVRDPFLISPLIDLAVPYNENRTYDLPAAINPNSDSELAQIRVILNPETSPRFINFTISQQKWKVQIREQPNPIDQQFTFPVQVLSSNPLDATKTLFSNYKLRIKVVDPSLLNKTSADNSSSSTSSSTNNLNHIQNTTEYLFMMIQAKLKGNLTYSSYQDFINRMTAAQYVEYRTLLEQELEKQEKEKDLMSKGFKAMEKLKGPNFPGINPNDVDAAIEEMNKNKTNQNETEELTVKISKIQSDMSVQLSFNQKTFAPDTVNNDLYKSVFTMAVETQSTGEMFYGKFEVLEKGPKPSADSNEKSNEEETSNGSNETTSDSNDTSATTNSTTRNLVAVNLTQALEKYRSGQQTFFTIEVTKHDEDLINMKLNFTEPELISLGVIKDELVCQIISPEVFKSKKTLLSLGESQPLRLKTPVQPQTDIRSLIQQIAEWNMGAINFLTGQNFFVSILLQVSLQQVFGLIRAIQIIVLTALVQIPMPNNAWEFYKASMFFAQLDIFDGSVLYSEWFSFTEASALNSNFELMLIDTRNYMINSGSFYILFVGILGVKLVKMLIGKLVRLNYNRSLCRRIGMMFFTEESSIFASLFRLHLEMYLDILFGIFLMAHVFMERMEGTSRFLLYLQSFDDLFQTVMMLIQSVLYVGITLTVIVVVLTTTQKGMVNLREIITEDIKPKRFGSRTYNMWFILRRLIMAWLLVFMAENQPGQLLLLLLMSLGNTAYIFHCRPFIAGHFNKIELFNEICIYALTLILVVYFDDNQFIGNGKEDLGLINISVILLNTLVNLVCIIQIQIKETIASCRRKYEIRRKTLAMNQYAIDCCDKNEEMFVREALKFCNEWEKHREWLDEQGIDYHSFPEEQEYQIYQEQYDFYDNKVEYFQLQRLQFQSAERKTEKEINNKIETSSNENKNNLRNQGTLVPMKPRSQSMKVLVQPAIQPPTVVYLDDDQQTNPPLNNSPVAKHLQSPLVPMKKKRLVSQEFRINSTRNINSIADDKTIDLERQLQNFELHSKQETKDEEPDSFYQNAVVKSLLSFQPFREYLLDIKQKELPAFTKLLVEMVGMEMVSDEFAKGVEALSGQISCKAQKPGHYYQALINKLIADNNDNPKEIKQINCWFLLEMVQTKTCALGHITTKTHLHSQLRLPKTQCLEEEIQRLFIEEIDKVKCVDCGVEQQCKQQSSIRQLPQLLAITLKKRETIQMNYTLDLNKYMEEAKGSTKQYQLSGMIIKKNNKYAPIIQDGAGWKAIYEDAPPKSVQFYQIFKNLKPAMVFYTLQQKEETAQWLKPVGITRNFSLKLISTDQGDKKKRSRSKSRKEVLNQQL